LYATLQLATWSQTKSWKFEDIEPGK
jgi:hypothetical protein